MADTSTSADPASLAQMLSLMLNAMKAQQGQPQNSGSKSTPTTGAASNGVSSPNPYNQMPSSDASDSYLQNWFGANQGRTVYDSNGNPTPIPGSTPGPSSGEQYGMASNTDTPEMGMPEPGTIRGWMGKGGILNGASFDNPLISQAEQLLQNYQSNSQSNASPLTTAQTALPATPKIPAQTITPYTPIAATNPYTAGLPAPPALGSPAAPVVAAPTSVTPSISAIPAPATPLATPAALAPVVPQTTIPANNPQAVTDMIGANANQAASNMSLTAGNNSAGIPSAAGSGTSQSFLNSLAPILRNYQSNQNTPSYSSNDLLGGAAQSGTYNAANPMPAPSSGSVINTAADPDPDPGLEGTGIQPGAGGGGGLTGAQQASGIGSSVGALISSIGTMMKPGVVGIPQMPSGVPLSGFKPATLT